MATFSGKDGDVKSGDTSLAEITNWSWTRQANVSKYGSNSSAGHKKAVAGTKENSGSFDFKLNTAGSSPLDEGDSVTLQLLTDGTNGWSVPAVVGEVQLDVDIDTGEVVGGSCSFEGNGAYSAVGS